MAPLLILRILLYLQLILGGLRFAGVYLGVPIPFIYGRGLWDFHILFGIIIAVLALIALRPLPGVPNNELRVAARFMPLAPLAIGLFMLITGFYSLGLVVIHVILGISVIGLVEVAAARQRRSSRKQ